MPEGVTRYRRERLRPSDPGWLGWTGALVAVTGAVVFAVWFDEGDPVRVTVLAAACFAAPTLAGLLRVPFVVGVVLVVAAGVGALAWAAAPGAVGIGYPLTWFVASGAGLTPLAQLHHCRWARRRVASAEGAPPSGLDPRHGRDVGLLATWSDGTWDYEAVDPRPDLVLDAVRALNGSSRSSVSVYRGKGRLDVGGDASKRVVVLQSDDRGKWYMVIEPHEPDDQLFLVVDNQRAPYTERQTTTLPSAERAVRTWMERGERDPGLEWWPGSTFYIPYRPKTLQLTD